MRRPTSATWILAAAALLATPAVAQAQASDEAAIRALVNEYAALVNRGDAVAYGAIHASDALIVEPDGRMVRGRAAIIKGFADDLAGAAKGLRMTKHELVAFRLVTPTSAVGQSSWEQTLPGQPAVRGVAFFAASKVAGKWILDGYGAVPSPAK